MDPEEVKSPIDVSTLSEAELRQLMSDARKRLKEDKPNAKRLVKSARQYVDHIALILSALKEYPDAVKDVRGYIDELKDFEKVLPEAQKRREEVSKFRKIKKEAKAKREARKAAQTQA